MGWAAAWDAPSTGTTINSALSYPGLTVTGQGVLHNPGTASYKQYRRQYDAAAFASVTNTGVAWFLFLADFSRDADIVLMGSGYDNGSPQLQISSLGTINVRSGGGYTGLSGDKSGSYTVGQVNLFVAKFTFSTKRFQMWINPADLSTEPAAGTAQIDCTGTLTVANSWLFVRNRTASGGYHRFDEYRMGASFADVAGGLVNGLDYEYHEGTWSVLPDFAALTPVAAGEVANFDLSVRLRDDSFGFVFMGYVHAPTNGTYTFYTTSDDGSKLYIGTNVVVNNDGLHAMRERSGTMGLTAGKHEIAVEFFEKIGGQGLEVRWQGPGISKQLIPSGSLYR